jgi:hypothetical protein
MIRIGDTMQWECSGYDEGKCLKIAVNEVWGLGVDGWWLVVDG